MSTVNIILGIYYSYIPYIGDSELESLYQERYKKALTYVYNSPNIKLVLYYSGPMLNWLEKAHPEYIAVLNELSNQKRVEILSGPYYEPILPLLSISDTLGQMEKMTTSIRKIIHKRSKGCWIPGSLWDQKIISNLSNSGFSYTFLDESYFINDGVKNTKQLFQSEDQGKSLSIFPLHSSFSHYLMEGEENRILQNLKKGDNQIISLFFPGDLLGEDGHLEQIQSLLNHSEKQKTTMNLTLPSDYLKEYSEPIHTIFLNSSSVAQYKEYFKQWYDNCDPDKNGADRIHFKNYIGREKTCNYLYGKSTYTSILINQIRGDRARKKTAREYLWKGQNHFSYWNSEKAYLSSRQSLYHFMEAEKLTREKGFFKSSIILMDLNNDGTKEFIFQGNNYNCAVNAKSSSLLQLDYLPDCWNYLFTEWGNESFQVKFLPKSFNGESVFTEFQKESAPITNLSAERGDKQVSFRYKKTVPDESGDPVLLDITKKYTFKRNWFSVSFSIVNLEEFRKTLRFFTNISLAFPTLAADSIQLSPQPQKTDFSKGGGLHITKQNALSLLDKSNNTDIQIDSSIPLDLWIQSNLKEHWLMPYSLNFYPELRFQLYPKESIDFTFTFRLSKHR